MSELEPTDQDRRRTELLDALDGAPERTPVGLGARAATRLTAVGTVALPVVYVVLVMAIGAGLGWYTYESLPRLRAGITGGAAAKQTVVRAAIDLSILIAGAPLFAVLARPLVRRRRGETHPRSGITLEPEREPGLYTAVGRLARLTGARGPYRVRIDSSDNVSADRDPPGVLLTIGAPAVAELDALELVGALAHEIRRAAPDTSPRSARAARAAREWLERIAENEPGRAGARLLGPYRWLRRRIVRTLLLLARRGDAKIECSRTQIADRFAVRLVGGHVVHRARARLEVLACARERATDALAAAHSADNLWESFPEWVSAHRDLIPPETADELRRRVAAPGERGRGAIRVDGPAAALFTDFDALARETTLAFYHDSIDASIESRDLVRDEPAEEPDLDAECRTRYFAEFEDIVYPFFWPSGTGQSDAGIIDATLDDLRQVRCRLDAELERHGEATARLRAAQEQFCDAVRAGAIVTSGLDLIDGEFGFRGVREGNVSQLEGQILERARVARRELDPLRALLEERWAIALEIACTEEETSRKSDAPIDSRELNLYGRTLDRLEAAWNEFLSLYENHLALAVMHRRRFDGKGKAKYETAFESRLNAASRDFNHLKSRLGDAPWPFPTSRRSSSVGDEIFAPQPLTQIPVDEAIAQLTRTIEGIIALHQRLIGSAARAAEAVETRAGLSPLGMTPANV